MNNNLDKHKNKTLPPLQKREDMSDDADFSDMEPTNIKLSAMKDREKVEGYEEFKKKLEEIEETEQEPLDIDNSSEDMFVPKLEKFRKYNKKAVKAGKFLLKFFIAIVIIAIVLYGIFFVTMKNDKNEYINRISIGISNLPGESYIPPEIKADGILNVEQKNENNLVLYLIDSDCDGLSDNYELNVSKTRPDAMDTDNDGVSDGAEIYFGLDPFNDNDDKNAMVIYKYNEESASIEINGTPAIYNTYFKKSENVSLNGAMGVIGKSYEYCCEDVNASGKISFDYNNAMVSKYRSNTSDLTVLKFNIDDNKFIAIPSEVDTTEKCVSADISENGIYALGDVNANAVEYTSQVYFLIDNSGSMFKEQLCEGSEENDVDFKRIDFVVNMLDYFDDGTLFGAGKFTGDYKNLCDINDDKESLKNTVLELKTNEEYFNGTEIAGSVIKSCNRFRTDGDYKDYIILLTDGMASELNTSLDEKIREVCADKNITVITVGIGKTVDTEYLQSMANDTNGMYFHASNAEALEDIYSKIRSFIDYNHVEITENNADNDEQFTINSTVIADSGFNINNNTLYYSNFRSSNSLGGSSFGISKFVSDYYSGKVEQKEQSFTTQEGFKVTGYDISDSTLADLKSDLIEWRCPLLDAYVQNMDKNDKYDYSNVSNGHLSLTANARSIIIENCLGIDTLPYEFNIENKGSLLNFVRKVTFNDINDIKTADCVYVSADRYSGPDNSIIKAICYNQNMYIDHKEKFLDFGYEGDEAFDLLVSKLSCGNAPVITIGNKSVVAIRLLKHEGTTDKFTLEVYDCDKPSKIYNIIISSNRVTDGNSSDKTQYVATYKNENVQMKILK